MYGIDELMASFLHTCCNLILKLLDEANGGRHVKGTEIVAVWLIPDRGSILENLAFSLRNLCDILQDEDVDAGFWIEIAEHRVATAPFQEQ